MLVLREGDLEPEHSKPLLADRREAVPRMGGRPELDQGLATVGHEQHDRDVAKAAEEVE